MTRPVFSGSDDRSNIRNSRLNSMPSACDRDRYQTARPRDIAVEEVTATEICGTPDSAEPAVRDKMLTLVIAHAYDIAGARIEAVLKAGGHSVIARCSHEDDLLRSVEAHRPNIIMVAENVVRQEAAKTVFQLRACNCSVAIIFLLEEREAITAVDLMDLDVEGILLSAACASSVIDCVETCVTAANGSTLTCCAIWR